MCGIQPIDYWSLTLGEITKVIEAYQKQKEMEQNNIKALIYYTAFYTASFVTNNFNGKQNPSFTDIFPNTDIKQTDDKVDELAISMYKEQFIDFAERYNKKRMEVKNE